MVLHDPLYGASRKQHTVEKCGCHLNSIFFSLTLCVEVVFLIGVKIPQPNPQNPLS